MLSSHDNIIVSYNVDFDKRQLTLRTKNKTQSKNYIDIIFNGYLTQLLEDEMCGSIIFHVYEEKVEKFIKENRELLERKAAYGWPIFYPTNFSIHENPNQMISELTDYFDRHQLRCYILGSSMGMHGWIIANRFSIVETNIPI